MGSAILFAVLALASAWLFRNAHAERQARRTWEAATDARLREHTARTLGHVIARLRELEAIACNDADEPPGDDERTRVYDGGHARRPTMLGGLVALHPDRLAGVKLERPTSSATRTAEAFRKQHGSSPTLISAGVTPGRRRSAPGPTTPPDGPAPDGDAEANQ